MLSIFFKKYTYIAIVQTPLQIISLNEYLNYKKINNDLFIIFLDNLAGRTESCLLTLKHFNFNYKHVCLSDKIINKIYNFFMIYLSLFFSIRLKSVIVGDYRVKFVRCLQLFLIPKKMIFIDDGLASIKLINSQEPIKLLDNHLNSKLLKKIRNFCSHYEIASFYLKKHSTNPKINIESLKLTTKKNLATTKNNSVLFVGSPNVENGYISLEFQLNFLNRLKSKKDKITYLAHHLENSYKLKKFESLGLNILRLDLPFELAYLKGHLKFSMIYSFWSSTLYNYKLISGLNNITAINVIDVIEHQKDLQQILEIYTFFDKVNIRVIHHDQI